MARLYSNENFPLQVVEELRRLGHDVLTIQETGPLSDKALILPTTEPVWLHSSQTWSVPFPSPLPSPLERGRNASRLGLKPDALYRFHAAELSPSPQGRGRGEGKAHARKPRQFAWNYPVVDKTACTFDPNFIAQARRIHEVLIGQPVLDGQLLKVNRPG